MWTRQRTRRLEGYSSPDYAIINNRGTAVITAADKPFKVVYDSHKPVQEPKPEDHREKGTCSCQPVALYTGRSLILQGNLY